MNLRLPNILKSLVAVGFVFILGIGANVLATSTPAYAYDKPEDIVSKDVSAWLTYRGVWGDCMGNMLEALNTDKVLAGNWFGNDTADFGYLTYDFGDEGDDRTIDIKCSDGSAIDRFADQIMEFDDEVEMFCVLNDKLNDAGHEDAIAPAAGEDKCEDSIGWNVSDPGEDAMRSAFTATLDEAPYRRPYFELTSNARDQQDKKIPGYNAWRYWIGKRSLEVMCGQSTPLTSGETDSPHENPNVVKVHIVDYETGAIRSANYEVTSGRLDDGDNTKFKARFDGDKHQELSCNDMAARTYNYSSYFSKYIVDYYNHAIADDFKEQFSPTDELKRALCGPRPNILGGDDLPTPEGRRYSACISNITNRFNSAVNTCRDSEALQQKISVAKRTDEFRKCLKRELPREYRGSVDELLNPNFNEQDDDDATDDEDVAETSCAIDGIGWIVCPLMNFMAELNERAFGILTNFLQIEDDLTTSPSLRAAWSTFRDMANIAFVIAFLIIIYSQITGMGVTNYGIKRLMPKMIIAAVLVNASLILCQIAVDLSNIVGSAIYNLLVNLANADSGSTNAAGGWTEVVGLLLAGAIGVGLLIAIFLAPTALLAVGAAVLILIARKAIIILLIVVSPLAFVAYLLPNTEDWFKKWWKMFSTLLMLFPTVGLVFGASSLAAGIINNVGGDADGQHLLQLTALGIMAVPLFAVPVVLKGALSAAGSIGQRLGGLQDRANRRGMRGIKEGRLGEAKTAFDARRQSRKLDRRVGDGRLGKINKAIDRSRLGRYIGGDRGAAAATAAVFHEFDEEVKRQKTLLSGRSNESLISDLGEGKGSEEYQAAVAGTLMSRNHRESHLQALDIVRARNRAAEAAGDHKGMEVAASIQKQMAHDMKDKPWALGDQATGQLVEGTYGRSTSTSGEAQRQFSEGIQEQLQERIGTKLSAQSLATMNPDEMNRIYSAAVNGDLTRDQLTQLRSTIGNIRDNKQMNALVKPEAQAQFDQILGETLSDAANRAPNNAATQQEAIDINARRDALRQRQESEGSLFDQ